MEREWGAGRASALGGGGGSKQRAAPNIPALAPPARSPPKPTNMSAPPLSCTASRSVMPSPTITWGAVCVCMGVGWGVRGEGRRGAGRERGVRAVCEAGSGS